MFQNQFYNQFFNQQYVTPDYYCQSQNQIAQYQQEQSKEVQNVAKAVHDLCEAYKKLDSQHQQQAFYIALAEMANDLGWNNR